MNEQDARAIVEDAIASVLQADATERDSIRETAVTTAARKIAAAFNLVRGIRPPVEQAAARGA